MKEIQLTQGQFALVDDEDFERVNQLKWFASKNVYKHKTVYYACKRTGTAKDRKTLYMHSFICGALEKGLEYDHIDRNPLNNQKANLRISLPRQNNNNKDKSPNCSSKYKGVCVDKRAVVKKYQVSIKSMYKSIYLGHFLTEEEAALEYDKKAIELFGEFAKLNLTPTQRQEA